jgi:hypothetical protein
VGDRVITLEVTADRSSGQSDRYKLMSAVRFDIRPDDYQSTWWVDRQATTLNWHPHTTPGGEVTFYVPGTAEALAEVEEPPGYEPGSVGYYGEFETFRYHLIVEPLDPALVGASEEDLFAALQEDIFTRGAVGYVEEELEGRRALVGINGVNDAHTASIVLLPVGDKVYEFRFDFDKLEWSDQAVYFRRFIHFHDSTGAVGTEPE